jgi:3-oxoacyl-[acyl-carrier-protein] synthase-1
LLETGRAVSSRGAEVLGWIQQVALGDSGRPLAPKGAAKSAPRDGIAFGKLLEGLVGASFDGDLLVDLNGEQWRASELGGAMARLGKRLGSARLLVPAVHVGEIGAAAAALALCFGVRSFRRGYARTGELLVTSLAESGRLAAIHLREA